MIFLKSIPRDRFKPYIIPTLIVVTAIALMLFPIADCVDCEFARPWGRDDGAYGIRIAIFSAWLLGTSFLVGLFRLLYGWIIPIAFVAIDCLAQPLGGVEWRSLINNEGPFIVLIGGCLGLASFAVGRLIGALIASVRDARLASKP